MVINVKKTFCAFRAVCPKTNMSKIVPQRYNKKNCHCQSTSIFVHFCQSTHKNYLEISKKRYIFALSKKNKQKQTFTVHIINLKITQQWVNFCR